MTFSPRAQLAAAAVLLAAGILLGRSTKRPASGSAAAPVMRSNAPDAPTQRAENNAFRARAEERSAFGDDRTRADLIGRFANCFTLDPPENRSAEFLHLLGEMRAEDAPAVLDLLRREQISGVFSESEWQSFWPRWGALDGPAALDYQLSLPDSAWNGNDVWLTMRGWAQTHPDEAAEWLLAHADVRHEDNAFLGYVDGIAGKDLKRATGIALASIPIGDPLLRRATGELAEQAVRQGKLAGLQVWFDSLPPDTASGSAKLAAVNQVWARLERSDFDAATEWVRGHASDPWRSDPGITAVAERLSATDPAGALKWLNEAGASPGNGTYPGLDDVVNNWAQRDPVALEKWLTQPNGGALQEGATRAYVAYLMQTDPIAAARWKPREKPGDR